MKQLFTGALALTKQIMRQFYCERCVEEILPRVAREAIWIGPGEYQIKRGYGEIAEYFIAGKDQVPHCRVEEDAYEIIYHGVESCVVFGRLKIYPLEETDLVLEFFQRVTVVYIVEDGVLKIRHMHLSIPDREMMREEHFPTAAGARNYEYIQRTLAEHIQAIDMLTITMKSGMKGTFDDENYSFFYVNEGLAKMLGYTHAEFMEKSGCCAAGSVYPPDRHNFLETCRKSLADGVEYTVEYRMEKKEGSLIWVMDTGRKVHNSDGTMLINSVVTDITELKNTVFALETERERYRIALENVTDVMFEYDILEDVFISFEKVESDQGVSMERIELQNFSEIVKMGEVICPEDADRLMDVFAGRVKETIDVRIRDPKDLATNLWSWKSVHCSVVYDTDRRPVRTIGALRDITKEKEREAKLMHQAQRDSLTGLLNQSAMKVRVKRYLLEKAPRETYALCIIDLDFFKLVNDTFGHLAGNAALLGVAEKLKSVCRSSDLIGRIGGDEFAVLLKDISLCNTLQKGEEILAAVRKIFIGNGRRITCSIGISFSENAQESYDVLFSQADKALYQAKAKGRNGYSFYEG